MVKMSNNCGIREMRVISYESNHIDKLTHIYYTQIIKESDVQVDYDSSHDILYYSMVASFI